MELVRDNTGLVRLRGLAHSHYRPLAECGQCGNNIDMPEWSENLEGGRVRHLWTCEVCGYSFETTVRFTAA